MTAIPLNTTGTFESGILIGDSGALGLPGAPAQPTVQNGAQVDAALEIQSTTGGLLLPRMTTAEIAAIPNSAPGTEFYNTDLQTVVVTGGVPPGGSPFISTAYMPRLFTFKVIGADNIRAAFASPNHDIIDSTNAPYNAFPFAARITMSGTAFSAVPVDLDVAVEASTGDSLSYLSLEDSDIFLQPSNKNVATFQQKGFTSGAVIGPQLVLVTYTGTPSGLTGGDATSTMLVEVFYM